MQPKRRTAAETEQGTEKTVEGKRKTASGSVWRGPLVPRLVIARQPRKDNDPMGPIRDSEERKERSSRKA